MDSKDKQWIRNPKMIQAIQRLTRCWTFLEIGIQRECGKVSGRRRRYHRNLGLNSSLLIISDTFFKEIGLALHGDHFHPFKWIARLVNLLITKSHEQAIRYKFNVGRHHVSIHPNQGHGNGFTNKHLFNLDSISDDFLHSFLREFVFQHGVQEASKITMQSFISTD